MITNTFFFKLTTAALFVTLATTVTASPYFAVNLNEIFQIDLYHASHPVQQNNSLHFPCSSVFWISLLRMWFINAFHGGGGVFFLADQAGQSAVGLGTEPRLDS
jgi:hypothetical protein